jgi:tetratricopeptide (TPR) repeat protein
MSRFGNLEFEGEAEAHESAAHNSGVNDEVRFLSRAQEAFENGLFESALRNYSKVLEYNPRNAAAWTGQVRMLIELGEFREARLWADKALEQFPQEPELLAAKAVALGRAGELQEAIAFSDASIEERGNTPYIWLARADVLLARREQRADYCFEKALGMAPNDWFVAWLAARIRYYYEQLAVALKLLQQALQWNASHFLLWLELGNCQLAMGWAGPATVSFTCAKELNPGSEAVRAALREAAKQGPVSRAFGWARRLFHR